MSGLPDSYLNGDQRLSAFFNGAPLDLFDRPSPTSWDPAFLGALSEYQDTLGLSREIDENDAVIATGQQPGILTGPLYTIYKAMTAICLARDYTKKTGKQCLPVFWVGADDHDFDEVRTAHILTKTHQDLTLTYAPTGPHGDRAMYRIAAETSLHDMIKSAAAAASGSEFREDIEQFLHESLDNSDSIADWFAQIIARLFRDTPLVVFPTYLPAARTASIPIFEREIREPLVSTRLLNEAGKALSALEFTPQVVKADDECGFYLEFDSRRCKVVYRDGHFDVPEMKTGFTADTLLEILHSDPGRFTANVVLRPIVQQELFPTVAYVAGPGEIAYWAQFRNLFEYFELPMPIVYPRAQAVLSTIKLNKLLNKYDLAVSDLAQAESDLVEGALRQSVKNPALQLLEKQRNTLAEASAEFVHAFDALKGKDKTPAEQAHALDEQIHAGLDRMERTLLRSDAAQTEAVRAQIERLCTALSPQRKPQERHYSIFSWLFEYGWDLIPRIMDQLDIESFKMNEIEL